MFLPWSVIGRTVCWLLVAPLAELLDDEARDKTGDAQYCDLCYGADMFSSGAGICMCCVFAIAGCCSGSCATPAGGESVCAENFRYGGKFTTYEVHSSPTSASVEAVSARALPFPQAAASADGAAQDGPS